MLVNYADWTEGAPLKYKQKMKDLLLFAQVAVKIANNFKLLFCE